MDAGASADPLQAPRPEEGEEKPKSSENQDDGYETSNSGEARRKPSSAEASPAPPAEPPSPPPEPEYDAIMRQFPPAPPPFRQQFDQPPPAVEPDYQHFPFPKYHTGDPYAFKREPDVPYDMSQHQPLQQHHPHNQFGGPIKRDGGADMFNGIKRECEDPYSFVEEEAMCAMLGQQHHQPHQLHDHQHHMMLGHQPLLGQPKKRGRKKKIKDENGMELKAEPGMEGVLVARPVKERKKHDRFNGMSEEEVSRRTLPDHLADNLDIIIIGINPGLFAAYKGHHYAGPGNHFWKCLYLSGLTREQMSADEDYKLLSSGIGFTNMVSRPTKGSADLTRREIKEGSAILLEKLQMYRPKVAVFNGKLIYEVFSGKKDFCFGKQPDTIAGTNTYMWVMPSSSARCAQLPRAADKVPYYAALKKFRDYLNGLHPRLDDSELVFPDTTSRRPQEEMEIRRYHPNRLTMEPEPGDTILLEDGTEVPLKKKRGRPKKVKLENGECPVSVPRAARPRPVPAPDAAGADAPPKKKRGRPKKIRPEEQQFLLQQQQQQQQQLFYQQQQQAAPMLQPQQQQQQQQQAQQQQQLPSLNPPLQYMAEFNDSNNIIYQDQPYFQPPTHPGSGMEGALDLPHAGYGAEAPYRSPRHMYERTPRPQRTQFPSSPAAFSAPSPPRGGSYGSPARGSFGSARSPLYAASPAAFQQPSPAYNQASPAYNQASPAYNQASPAYNQASPAYNQASPAGYQQASPAGLTQARFSQSPAPLTHSYSNSPVPQLPFSRSPGPGSGAPGSGTPFPAGDVEPYTPSPHTPASQQPSPIEPAHHQGGSTASNSGSAFTGELSADMSGGMSPAVSPPLPLDFEPPAPRSRPASATPTHIESESVGGVGESGGFLYESSPRLYPLPLHSPGDNKDLHYHQDNGSGVASSPRLEQLHQHPSMYPSNFNRSTPPVVSEGPFSPHAGPFRSAPSNNPSNEHPGSPSDYSGAVKTKSQDVASKSLSGLESLVDQIPSIAEGGAASGAAGGEAAPPPPLAEYAPPLYQPYAAYPAAPYANNAYGGGFVGYGGGWAGQLMRPTPGYLSDWQYPPYAPAVPPYPYNNYYNQYTPPHTHQAHYLSTPPLLELHKNSEHAGGVPPVAPVPSVPSVGFGGFC